MYGSRFWYRAPFWYIPASLLWVGLEFLLEHFQIVRKCAEKNPKNEKRIKNIWHVICGFSAHLITIVILLAIYRLTGIDLLDFGDD